MLWKCQKQKAANFWTWLSIITKVNTWATRYKGPDNRVLIPRAKEKQHSPRKDIVTNAHKPGTCVEPKEMQTEERVVRVREGTYGKSSRGLQAEQRQD